MTARSLTGDPFQWKQDGDREPVKHVMHGGASEGSTKLLPVYRLTHRHERVRHRRPDV